MSYSVCLNSLRFLNQIFDLSGSPQNKNMKNAIETSKKEKSKRLAGTTWGLPYVLLVRLEQDRTWRRSATMSTVMVAPCRKDIYFVLFYLCAPAVWKL